MKTFETIAVVSPDHTVTLNVPPDIPVGEHRLVVVIEDYPGQGRARVPLSFSSYPVGLISDAFTFQREDLYGDDGR
jgi:hypothetical protein